jgi:hypothetical protein
MVRFLADENFNNQIVRGVLRQSPDVDIVRVQDADLSGADDPTVLAWGAQEGRIVLTHDVATMTTFAYERIQAGLPMPGLFEVSRRVPVGLAIEEIILIAECSLEGEWEGQVRFLPLRWATAVMKYVFHPEALIPNLYETALPKLQFESDTRAHYGPF